MLSSESTEMATPLNKLQVHRQNAVIAHHMMIYLLKEQGIRPNCHAKGKRSVLARDEEIQEAISVLESSCKEMRPKYLKELEKLVHILDVSDSQLYPNYLETCTKLMADKIGWGRIAVLFFFTGILAERLHKEGQVAKIESLFGWLKTFINDNLTLWILEQGGWGAIKGAVNVSEDAPELSNSTPGSALLAVATVGVGAVIIAALTFK